MGANYAENAAVSSSNVTEDGREQSSHLTFCRFVKIANMFFGPKVDMSPAEFKVSLEQDGGKVLDCRTADECADGMLSGAIQADWLGGEVPAVVAEWDKKEAVYCYCRSGGRSGAAAKYLKGQGFENVYNVGGYSALKP
jgi:rhodanese-related sulfurtransferase